MNYFWPGQVNTHWEPGPVNTNWELGPANTNLVPGPVNTNWGPGSVNTHLVPGAGGQDQGQGPSKGPRTGKYKYPRIYCQRKLWLYFFIYPEKYPENNCTILDVAKPCNQRLVVLPQKFVLFIAYSQSSITLKGSQYIFKLYSMLFQQTNKKALSNKLLTYLLTDNNAI